VVREFKIKAEEKLDQDDFKMVSLNMGCGISN
jgi:hypothetical protein